MKNSKQKITTFLMFSGNAEEAMNFYISIFDKSEIINITRYEDGKVMHALFSLNGQEFMCIDSNVEHGFTFTPAISLYVNCYTSEEIDNMFGKLAEGGMVLMPLGAYPFSEKFGWVQDKYGVSWQLTLAIAEQ